MSGDGCAKPRDGTYEFCLNRLESEAGDRIVREMNRRDVYLLATA